MGRTPIPGESPAGQPLAGDDDFDAMRQEVGRDPIHGVPTDWAQVVRLGEKILSSKSKDVTAASYLAVALMHEEGFAGLRDGLQIVLGILEQYWDSAYPPVPKRLRGRLNALSWLGERGASAIGAREPTDADREGIQESSQVLADLWKLVEEKCEGQEVGLGDLSRALREYADRLPAPAPGPATAEPTPQPAAAAPAAAPQPGPAARAPAAADASQLELKSRADLPRLLSKCARFSREKDPQEPLGYRLTRVARWSEFTRDPPEEDGKLGWAGPAAERIAVLGGMAAASDWGSLLEEAEDLAWQFPLFLDAHRYSVEALLGLGPAYKAAADGIVDDLRSLLGRAPRLPRLAYQDGTPLADPETQRWIEQEVKVGAEGAAGGAAAAVATAAGVDPEELEAARREARALAKKRELPAALARLEQATGTDSSPRGRFLARLELAVLCAESGHDRLALPILAELDGEVQRYGLEAWEPDLSLRVLEASYTCQKRVADARDAPPEARARAEEFYERLCRVSPIAAAALE